MLFQLILNDTHGQLCRIDRDIDLLEHIGQCTDMILMSVGDDKSLHLGYIVFQISDVRNHQINAQHVILRERESAVHNDDTVLILERRNVHTDLFQSAQRYDTQFSIVLFFQIIKHLHFILCKFLFTSGHKKDSSRTGCLPEQFIFLFSCTLCTDHKTSVRDQGHEIRSLSQCNAQDHRAESSPNGITLLHFLHMR